MFSDWLRSESRSLMEALPSGATWLSLRFWLMVERYYSKDISTSSVSYSMESR